MEKIYNYWKKFPKTIAKFLYKEYNMNCKIFPILQKYLNRRMKKVDNKITVLIADDNHDFAMTLLQALKEEKDLEVVGVAKDGKEASE